MTNQFYDSYIKRQVESGINNRIYYLFRQLKKYGLRKDLKILEIGCGIGALTYLLSGKIKTGLIEAVDFSEKSIEYARKNCNKPNIHFASADILEYSPQSQRFDFILLFDVLEHIPIERQAELFSKINSWMHENSVLFINLPNPDYIRYDQKHNPQALQEIDQPISLEKLSEVLCNCHLKITQMKTYSIWVKNEYQFYVIHKSEEFEAILLEKNLNILQKLRNRLQLQLRKIRYNYPKSLP